MGKLPKDKPRPPRHPILWEDVRKLEQYSAQIKLLCVHKIDTSEQLQAFVDSTKINMDALIAERTRLQNKLRRAVEPGTVAVLRAKKTGLTKQIAPLRKDLKLCEGIRENTARMKEKTAMIRLFELQEKQKTRARKRGREYDAR
jgi:hypothetical protein